MFKDVSFTGEVFKENGMYVAYCPELDLSSCGPSIVEAKSNLLQATRLFMEESLKMGTLKSVLEEAGYDVSKQKLESPLIEVDHLNLNVEVGKN